MYMYNAEGRGSLAVPRRAADVLGSTFLPRDDMLCLYAVMRCLCPSVCPSVTFVYSVKTNKHIFNFFSPSDSLTILVFPYQT